MAVAKKAHFFVVNRMGDSVHRKGAFESREAAKEWIEANYTGPCWLIPAEYAGRTVAEPLGADGKPVREE